MTETPEFQKRYARILSEYIKNSDEQHLLKAADLGRELVVAGIPPEEIVEIHELALAEFATTSPNSTVAETYNVVSAPLMELLMAYGLAFREQLDSRKEVEDIQRLRNEQLQALANIAGILAGPDSLEEKQILVLEELAELMQADGVVLRRINDAGTELVIVGQTGPMYATSQPSMSPLLSFQTYSSGETLVINNYVTDPIRLQDAVDLGVESAVFQPVGAYGQVYGVIAVVSTDPNHFTDNRVQVLTAISDGFGVLLENARLYEEARKRAREIQRLNDYSNRILDSNPLAMAVITGSDRQVESVNRSFCELWGVSQREVAGRRISQVLPLDGLDQIITESLLSNPEDRQKEMTYLAQDESERCLLVSVVPLLKSDQTDSGEESLLVLSDITEQRQQQEIMQGHSRLASVGELAAGVAHEINNPLAAILGLSELIQMENVADGITEDAKKIQDAAQRAARIVQNLLFFARKNEPERGYMVLSDIIDHSIELKAHDFRLNNIQVTTRYSNRVPAAMIDELQMIQVMLNILTNAEQAIIEGLSVRDSIQMGQKAGEITVSTRLRKGKIRITISDDGPGLPAGRLNRIFDPFFTTKQAGQGTGLGLSICYGIVREHGGELWAESKPGEGASFHI
ncbi:MAG: GAF domain-containing protein, partial [Chloroflexi bacterium]|nr:GAF domain-containing protein [Chloroflexota bacterium]